MPVRPRFDPKRALVAARAFLFAGVNYAPGDHFDPDRKVANRIRERQYEARAVNFLPEDEAPTSLITMTGPSGGRYQIHAPWFEKPLTVRGKKNADEAFAEITEDGAPLGWIEGGTETEVEEVGGGWYEITAPWLDEPVKVQGREDAEAEQLKIHTAGAPAPEGDESEDDGTEAPADGEEAADGAENDETAGE